VTVRMVAGAATLFLVLAGPAPAAAQEFRGDLEAGADLGMRVTNKGVTDLFKTGWHAGASYRVAHLISVIAVLSGDYDKRPGYTANVYLYAGGVRFGPGVKERKLSPFVQVVLGAGQDNGTGNGKINRFPLVTPGLGADLKVATCAAIRFGLDFPLLMRYSDMLTATRFSVGLAFQMGTR
jgi:hypothetical protein